MTEYQMKPGQAAIQIVDGELTGRQFRPGMVYTEIPAAEAHRFDELPPPAAPAARTKKQTAEEAE